MTTTYPLPTLAAVITPTGITVPSYSDIYQSLQVSFQSIFGSDSYATPDSQDGQLLAIVAKAIVDCNATAVAVYNSFSPATAQGAGLSNAVKINGMKRAVTSNSSAVVTITGQVGSTITNGVVGDANRVAWNLPASVVIPLAGFINVTATCSVPGAITAAINTLTLILTPTLGWQSATNAAAASVGAPVEQDATLRQRQTVSVALPSKTVLAGLKGAILAVAGVTQAVIFENDSAITDSNGLPHNSIAAVVLGGATTDIANAIMIKKTPGAFSYGTTSVPVVDSSGVTNTIRYFIPTAVAIKVSVILKALTGYSSAYGVALLAAIQTYINGLGINQTVYIGRLYLPAQLFGGLGSNTFDVVSIQISASPAAVGNVDVPVAFNAIATSALSDMVLSVT